MSSSLSKTKGEAKRKARFAKKKNPQKKTEKKLYSNIGIFIIWLSNKGGDFPLSKHIDFS